MVRRPERDGPGTMRARTRLSPTERREHICIAACDLALTEGLQNVTHRSVAVRLGVTHALVVHYETDIEALRTRVCSRLLIGEMDEINAQLMRCETAVARLAQLIRILSCTGREEFAGLWLDAWSLGRRSPAMAEQIRAIMDKWQDMVTGIIMAGVARTEFSVADPEACAWEFIALLDGLNAHAIVSYGDPADYRQRLAAPLESRLGMAPGTLTQDGEIVRPAESETPPLGAPITTGSTLAAPYGAYNHEEAS